MREPIRPTTLRNHVVLVGHGRVGSFISSVLGEQSVPLFVIEDDEDGVAALRQEGIAALEGNAADPAVIEAANLPEARCLLVAIPDAFEGGQVVQQAHAINPNLPIIARAHSQEEIDYLKRHGATLVVMGEHEIAKAMLDNVAQIALLVAQSSREAAAVQPESMPVEKAALDRLKLSPPIMPHYTPLITTIVAALTLAWAFAAVAHKVKLPPLVGYLLAGVVVGPFTPGYVADQDLASELAEIGVILLMFGVGLHFSLEGPAGGAAASPCPARSCRSPSPRCSAWGSACVAGLGDRRPASSSASRCRSPAPSCCCARCRSGACSTPSAAASPSAG